VGAVKLVTMSVATLGVYNVYWQFQQWRRVRDSGDDVQPLWRAVFAAFFCHSLFSRIEESTFAAGVDVSVPAGLLTVAFIGLSLCWRLPGAAAALGLLAVVPLVIAQRTATAVALKGGSEEAPNTRLRGWNWLAVGALALVAFLGVLSHIPMAPARASQAFVVSVAMEVNKTLPRMVDAETELVEVLAREGQLVYRYRLVKYTRDQIDVARLAAGIRKRLIDTACRTPATRTSFLDRGVALQHVYGDKYGREMAIIDVAASHCRP